MARDLLMLSLRPRLMLLFSMADMGMVVLVILVLATMVRGLLMLSPRPRLMLLFSMEDMAVDMLDLDMPDMEVTVLDMAVVSIMVKSYLPFFMKQKLKVISDWHVVIQCPLLEV